VTWGEPSRRQRDCGGLHPQPRPVHVPRRWLPDGSRLTYLDEPVGRKASDRLLLRVAGHNVVLPGTSGELSETYAIATTLLDHREADAGPSYGVLAVPRTRPTISLLAPSSVAPDLDPYRRR